MTTTGQKANPTVAELPASASPKEIAEIVRRDGAIIVKNLVSEQTLAKIKSEFAQSHGGSLCAQSYTAAHELLANPTYTEVSKNLLRDIV